MLPGPWLKLYDTINTFYIKKNVWATPKNTTENLKEKCVKYIPYQTN